MGEISASASGQFKIGGDLSVHRLGFGAMRVTGGGAWGEPDDPSAARETLKRLRSLEVNFVDTADAYGPFVSEDLLREVLHPYDGIVIATKGGLVRPRPDGWDVVGRPEYLRQCVLMSLRRLRLERIDLWQLHAIDKQMPREEQFGVIAEMRKEGLIRHAGLSNVSVDDIELAQKYFPVATVQNRYNLADRRGEDVLSYCEKHGIGFMPWYPLAAGKLTGPGTPLGRIAERLRVTPSQLALAWTLRKSRVMLPIPGTGKPEHLAQNVAAAAMVLSEADFVELEHLARGDA
jgi:aryl-alcohol dehydrogenase-like predicted oxidoreductase